MKLWSVNNRQTNPIHWRNRQHAARLKAAEKKSYRWNDDEAEHNDHDTVTAIRSYIHKLKTA